MVFVVLVLLIRLPHVQQGITDFATGKLADAWGTKFTVGSLYLTFRGDVHIEELMLEDQQNDTLLYLNSLETGISFSSLLNNSIDITKASIHGAVINIYPIDSTNRANYQFIIDYLAGGEPETLPEDSTDDATTPINFGPVSLTDIQLRYLDYANGTDLNGHLASLTLITESLGFDTMDFRIKRLEVIGANYNLRLLETPGDTATETASAILPVIEIDHAHLQDIAFNYMSVRERLFLASAIESLEIQNLLTDLNTNNISTDYINLDQSLLHLADSSVTTMPAGPPSGTPFQWPEWEINSQKLAITNHHFRFDIAGMPQTPGIFNPDHLNILLNDFQLNPLTYKPADITLGLDAFNGSINEKFLLEKFTGQLHLDDKTISGTGMDLSTTKSRFAADLALNYPSFQKFMEDPAIISLALQLSELNVDLREAYFFQPQLDTIPIIHTLAQKPIRFSGNLKLSPENIDLNQWKGQWGANTKIAIIGSIENYLAENTDSIYANIANFDIETIRKDILTLSPDSIPKQLLPGSVRLKGKLQKSPSAFTTHATLDTDLGNIALALAIDDLQRQFAYTLDLGFEGIALPDFLESEDFKPVSGQFTASGHGKNIWEDSLSGMLKINDFSFRGYQYQPLQFELAAGNGLLELSSAVSDSSIDLVLFASARQIAAESFRYKADIDLNGINLKALKLTEENIKHSQTIQATLEQSPQNLEGRFAMQNNITIVDDNVYRWDDVSIDMALLDTSTTCSINSGILNGTFYANANLEEATHAINRYAGHFYQTDTASATHSAPGTTTARIDMVLTNSPFLGGVLLPGLNSMDSITIKGSFDEPAKTFSLSVLAPEITYADAQLDQLELSVSSSSDSLASYLRFAGLTDGPVQINKTTIDFNSSGCQYMGKIQVADGLQKTNLSVGFLLGFQNDTIDFSLMPDNLVLNELDWQVPPKNQIRIGDNYLYFKDFELSQNNHKVALSNIPGGEFNNGAVQFNNFNLEGLFAVFNVENIPIEGIVNGHVRISEIFTRGNLAADMQIDSLTVLSNLLGTLKFDAVRQSNEIFSLDASIIGHPIDLQLKGEINTTAEDNLLHLDADLNQFDVALLEAFTFGAVRDSRGTIAGHFDVEGTTTSPVYNGELHFNKASTTIDRLNVPITLSDEKIFVSNDAIAFDRFTIKDKENNTVVIDGRIITKNLANPAFDLNITSSKFGFLDATKEDNELLYGKASINLDLKLRGDLILPVIDMQARLNSGADITYVLPETELELIDREGIVKFVNVKDTLNPIMVLGDGKNNNAMSGFSLKSRIRADPGTNLTLVFDKQSGDFVKVGGTADLGLDIAPSGQITLNGQYIFEQGSYEMGFYDIVKRKFQVAPGSKISWSGDPYQADLDLQAVYLLNTSVTDLMADQISSADASGRASYALSVPIEVKLFIDGGLNNPAISFALDMPADDRGAASGNVYGKLMQINENESQLNKQVFSLIVFNQFLPSEVASAEYNGRTQMARSSVNKILSAQLNNLSQKYIKGIDLDFNFNSYANYQQGAGVDRTDLNLSIKKALFNDRVVVKVGSNVNVEGENSQSANEIFEDFSIEYLLTENGQYRLRGFRKNTFLDLVEGQIIITGLALLFNKEFNDFDELFDKPEKLPKNKLKLPK